MSSPPATPGTGAALHAIPRRALLAISCVLILWTSNILWVRQAGDHITAFTAWRMIFAVPVLAVIAFATRAAVPEAATADRRLPTNSTRVAMVGVGVLFSLSAFVNFVSLNETTLVNVGVIHALQPAVVAIVAGRLLGEVVDLRLAGRAAFAIVGAVLVAAASVGQGSWSLAGDLLAVLGLFMNSAWFVAGRWIRTRTTIDATQYMLFVFGTSAVTMTAVVALSGSSLAVPGSIVGLAMITALAGTVGHTVMTWAHRYVPASISSLFLLSQPVLVAGLAWIAFDEALRPLHLLGGAIVLGALAGIVTQAGAEPSPEAPGVLPDARDEELADGP